MKVRDKMKLQLNSIANDTISDLIDEIAYDQDDKLRPTQQELNDKMVLDSMSQEVLTEDEEKIIEILNSLYIEEHGVKSYDRNELINTIRLGGQSI